MDQEKSIVLDNICQSALGLVLDVPLLVGARYNIEKISLVKIENRIHKWILTGDEYFFKIRIASEKDKVIK